MLHIFLHSEQQLQLNLQTEGHLRIEYFLWAAFQLKPWKDDVLQLIMEKCLNYNLESFDIIDQTHVKVAVKTGWNRFSQLPVKIC